MVENDMRDIDRRRSEEAASVREWKTMHPVKDFVYTITAFILMFLIFVVPVILFAYLIATGLLELISLI